MAPDELALAIGAVFGIEALIGVVFFTRALLDARNDVVLFGERDYDYRIKAYLNSQLWIMRFKLASQVFFLIAALVFALALWTNSPSSSGSGLRSIVVPAFLICGEGCILLVGYELDRQRVALKRQVLANGKEDG